MTSRHILIRGGGHAQPEPFYRLLVNLTGKAHPRIAYLGTAGGDSDYWTLQNFKGL